MENTLELKSTINGAKMTLKIECNMDRDVAIRVLKKAISELESNEIKETKMWYDSLSDEKKKEYIEMFKKDMPEFKDKSDEYISDLIQKIFACKDRENVKKLAEETGKEILKEQLGL